MNLSDLREGELKSAFNALEDAFSALDIDFYLIGALARDTWYAELNKRSRATKDVDFAVMIGSQKDYDAAKKYLAEHKNFIAIKNNSFVMKSPGGVEVDMIDRADGCINLCEMKFASDVFEVSKSYAKELDSKQKVFQSQTKTRKTLFLTMVTTYGVKNGTAYPGLIEQEITIDSLFNQS
jgi:hypothetical protein